MPHWPFIIGAYSIAVGGVLAAFVHALVTMRRAEREAERLRQERRR